MPNTNSDSLTAACIAARDARNAVGSMESMTVEQMRQAADMMIASGIDPDAAQLVEAATSPSAGGAHGISRHDARAILFATLVEPLQRAWDVAHRARIDAGITSRY